MNKQQELHDQIVNLINNIKPIVPALRALTDQADKAVADRLNTSLNKIDLKVNNVTSIIDTLEYTAQDTTNALKGFQSLVLKELQEAVTMFADNEMSSRYDDKIVQLIKDIKEQVDSALISVVEAKSASIEAQVLAMQETAKALNGNVTKLASFNGAYNDGHKQIVDDIKTFEDATKERIEKAETKASKELDKVYKSVESMSIKRIAAVAAACTAAMIVSLVLLVWWYVPSMTDISELKDQQTELKKGIDELQTGWKNAFDEAQEAELMIACEADEAQPSHIGWCIRTDSKNLKTDEKGVLYYALRSKE